MKDEEIWKEAAENIYNCIQKLDNGSIFSDFGLILLHNVYLITSLAYYRFNESYMSDNTFDQLCKYLLDNFDVAEKMIRNASETLTKDRLSAGTGFDLKYSAAIWNIYLHFSRLAGQTVPTHFKKKDK